MKLNIAQFGWVLALFIGWNANSAFALVGMDQKVFEGIQNAQQLAEEKAFDEAHNTLAKLRQRKHLSDYEIAQILSLSGYIYTQQEKYPLAIEQYKAVAVTKDITEGLKENALYLLVQLHMITEDYKSAIQYAETLREIKKVADPNLLVLIAQCHYRVDHFDIAKENLERAIVLEEEAGRPPKENWLLLANAIAYSCGDTVAMEKVLVRLIDLYPRDRYVLNLASVYGQKEESERQLLLLEPLYEAGLLKARAPKILLAQLYILHNVPEKGARVLQSLVGEADEADEIRDLELLAQAWTLAKEPDKAVAPLTAAAKRSRDGNNYVRLAQAFISMGDWASAKTALRSGIKKGHLSDEANGLLMLGMAQYNLKQFSDAIQTFQLAKKHDSIRELSEKWIGFVEREKERYDLARS